MSKASLIIESTIGSVPLRLSAEGVIGRQSFS
jgi:hypothetical protein